MAQRAGRITCPRCGANNFDTVTSCWKCGAPVGSAAMAGAAPMPAPVAATISAPMGAPGAMPTTMPAPMGAPAAIPAGYGQERMAPPVPYSQTQPGDSGVARRAAIALGLTIPFVGLPVGWIFMMIEDRSKQTIGRWCATWSMIGLVIHLILTYIMIQNAVPFLLKVLTPVMAGAAAGRNAAGSDGLPAGGVP